MTVGELKKELEKHPEDLEAMFDIYTSRELHFDEAIEEVSVDKVFRGQGCFKNIVFLGEVKK